MAVARAWYPPRLPETLAQRPEDCALKYRSVFIVAHYQRREKRFTHASPKFARIGLSPVGSAAMIAYGG